MRKENQWFQFSPWRISDSVLNHELICLAWLSKFPKALNKSAQARTATSRSPAVLTFPCPQLLFLVLHNPLSRQHRLLYLLLSNISAGWAAKQTLVPAQGRWQNLNEHEDAETIKQCCPRGDHTYSQTETATRACNNFCYLSNLVNLGRTFSYCI